MDVHPPKNGISIVLIAIDPYPYGCGIMIIMLGFEVPAISIHFCFKKSYTSTSSIRGVAPKAQESRAKSAPLSALEAWAREDLCLDLGHPTMLCMWLLHPGIPTASILYILIHCWILSMFLLVYCRPPIFSKSFSQQIGTSDHTGLINSRAFWALSMAQEISP